MHFREFREKESGFVDPGFARQSNEQVKIILEKNQHKIHINK